MKARILATLLAVLIFTPPAFSQLLQLPLAYFPIDTNSEAMGMATDGSGYLVGVEDPVDGSIGAQLLGLDGSRRGPLIEVGRLEGGQGGANVDVAFDGTNYLMTWEENASASDNTGLRGHFISATGALVGSTFAVRSAGTSSDGIEAMAFGGGKYLVTYTRLIDPALGDVAGNRYIAGTLVGTDGTVGPEIRISAGYGNAASVTFDGARFFVVWRGDSGSGIRGRFVSTSGVPGTEVSVNASAAASDSPEIAFDGSNYLVVWIDHASGMWRVRDQRVSTGGALVGEPLTMKSPGEKMLTSVGFDGTHYLAVGMDTTDPSNWDMRILYISTDGSIVGESLGIDAPGNQFGFVGCANERCLGIVNDGVQFEAAGNVTHVESAKGLFVNALTGDEFNGSQVDTTRWVESNPTAFTEIGGYLHADVSPSVGFAAMQTVDTYSGDTGATLDFSDFRTNASNSYVPFIILYLADETGNGDYILIYRGVDGNQYIMSSSLDGSTTDYPQVQTTVTSGQLRIVRSGASVTTYYNTGDGWQSLRTFDGFGNGTVVIGLGVATGADGSTQADFNSIVIQGQVLDTDNDGIPDAVDTDDDNDGIPDVSDPYPLIPSVVPGDADGDGVPDSQEMPVRLDPSREIALPLIGRRLTMSNGTPLTIPSDVTAVSLNVTAVNPDGPGYITIWPCSASRPQTSNLNYVAEDIVPNSVIAPVGSDGKVCFYSYSKTDLVVDVSGYFRGNDFVGATPMRLVDTRYGTGASQVKVTPSAPLAVQITGLAATTAFGDSAVVPSAIDAAALNVTVVNPAGQGYVTVYPCDVSRPLASNVNFVKDEVVANGVIAPVSHDGKVCIYASTPTDVVVDLAGWFTGKSFTAATPRRLADTRDGTGAPNGKIGGSNELTIPVVGQKLVVGGALETIPPTATAVALNVTVTDPGGDGYLTVYPCGVKQPLASNLNYVKSQVVANNVIAAIGSSGDVCVYSSTGANVVVDISGWFQRDGTNGYVATTPQRLVDSRVAVGPPPTIPSLRVQDTTVALNVMGTAPSAVSGTIPASDPDGLPLAYSIASEPTVGAVQLDPSSGRFTYTVPGNSTKSSDSFAVDVTDGNSSKRATVDVQLHDDPLLANEWYIQNTGTSAFSSTLPVARNDMDVAGAWADGFTGKGVKVAVVDTGLEIAHEDLAANIDVAHSYNFVTGTDDPSPDPADKGFDHGTQVAGIIGAVAFNGKGGRGVAYDVSLRGYNFLQSQTSLNYALSLGGMPASADNDIFNLSACNTKPVLSPIDDSQDAIEDNLQTLRNGRGAIFVKAAGNNFAAAPEASDGSDVCQYAEQFGVSCGDPVQDQAASDGIAIVVGATDADGEKASYSSTGSSIWVVAPGGEAGVDAGYLPGLPPELYEPAMVTTARTGCENAEYPGISLNALDNGGQNPFAANCQYTALMNGTSSAAPNVSATVALMLQANPNLGWRDVKYILASTARHIDPGFTGIVSGSVVAGHTVTLEPGWVENAAGFWFSNRYGFGEVDATAAVRMAETYKDYLPPLQRATYSLTATAGRTLPAESTLGLIRFVNVSVPFSTVEEVQLKANIASTPVLLCNQIEVRSPSGTKSILLHAVSGFTQNSVTDARLLSNAFYGESVNGTWTVIYYNFCPEDSILSETRPQEISFIGH